VTVCFADLVGFTRLGEQVAPDELGRVAHRLVELTAERLRGDVRLVKTIGDAAMIVGPDAHAMLELALDLVDAADAEGDDFPQLRVGMAAGPALSRAGDWYGRPVNLASRVTGIARPGSVLATARCATRRADGLPLVLGRRALAEGRRGARAPVPRAAPDARRRGRRGRLGALPAAGADDRQRRLRPRGTRLRPVLRGHIGLRAAQAAHRRLRQPRQRAESRPRSCPSSVCCRPMASAIGPHTAMPSGMRPIETLKS
jgi:hypothetical protein